MNRGRRASTSLALGVLLWVVVATYPATAQRVRPAAAPRLPPISMTCPMHPDVVEDKPGSCPLCKMALVPVRLEAVWTCPVHQGVIEHARGACPICRRDLIQVTVALTWTCPGHPDVNAIEPGRCDDGSAMVAKRTLRPHGNHNPQHGGQFFMAPDNWHHLEGSIPRARLFRLYLYDDYARPLPADQIKQVRARLVTKESYDTASRRTNEITALPLLPSPTGPYLEARVDPLQLPASVSAKVKFKADAPEYRFDFTFAGVTRDPSPPPVVATVSRPAQAAPKRTRATATPAVNALAPDAPPPPDPSLVTLPIPDSLPEILAQLSARSRQVRELIDRGNFAAVFVPAFQAKDLAIALEQRLDTLPDARRAAAAPAIEQLVRTAWLLDASGDIGNRQQLLDADALFTTAVSDVTKAFAP